WIDRLLGVLLDNACRYSPPGGTVTVRTAVTGLRVRVAVEDDGPGIPEHERERLFDRFHRATSEPGGAGLGLAIADAVVRSTGGIWHITNHPGGGARMQVSWHGWTQEDTVPQRAARQHKKHNALERGNRGAAEARAEHQAPSSHGRDEHRRSKDP